MRKLWEKEYCLRASDFDIYNRLKPSSILDLFQDAAGQHAIELGVGFEKMSEHSYLWVLTKIKFRVITNPKNYQRVTVKTWPLAPNRLSYRREYCIEDEKGEKLVVGSSEWVVIHSEKRRFVCAPDLYPFDEGFCEELMLEEKLSKIGNFTAEGEPHRVSAGFTELDVNRHVNNTKYANYVLDAINPQEKDELEYLQIDYRKEVLQGTKLAIYHKREQDTVLARGENSDGETMFACKLEYKKTQSSR